MCRRATARARHCCFPRLASNPGEHGWSQIRKAVDWYGVQNGVDLGLCLTKLIELHDREPPPIDVAIQGLLNALVHIPIRNEGLGATA